MRNILTPTELDGAQSCIAHTWEASGNLAARRWLRLNELLVEAPALCAPFDRLSPLMRKECACAHGTTTTRFPIECVYALRLILCPCDWKMRALGAEGTNQTLRNPKSAPALN